MPKTYTTVTSQHLEALRQIAATVSPNRRTGQGRGHPRTTPTVLEDTLVQQVADATGSSVDDVGRVYDLTLATIGAEMRRHEPVQIDKFGTFRYTQEPNASSATMSDPAPTVLWHPDVTMRARIAGDPPPPTAPPTPPGPARPARDLPPLRPIDKGLIDRWLQMKSTGGLNGLTTGTVFHDPAADGQARRPWIDTNSMRTALQMLARWLPCPLHLVGYQHVEGTLEFDRTLAQEQILQAVTGLTARVKQHMHPRILEHAQRVYPNDNPALHGTTWAKITTHGPQFYDWLEFCRVRGQGTNPLLHLRRATAVSIPRKYWLQLSLIDPLLQAAATAPLEMRAVVYLLANGLRRSEVAPLKVEDVLLARGELRVYGKGSSRGAGGARMRVVPLLPWTRQALDDWLASRAGSLHSPWLFPHPWDPELHIRSQRVEVLLKRLIKQVHPNEPAAQGLSPHCLRLWFVSRSNTNHVPTDKIMAATGHSSLGAMQTYLVSHPLETKAAYEAATEKQWF